MSFEPSILGFLCNWCSYAGADLAGVSRFQYPPNLRVIRVMCSGRVDPAFIFKALQTGIDGVLVMGCHPGDCHYLEGNYEAEKKFIMVKKFLRFINFESRVHLEWVSASEGSKFAQVVTKFTETVKNLGPSPLREEYFDNEILEKLLAIDEAASTQRIRALVGRERAVTEIANEYGEKITLEKFESIMNSAIYEEYVRAQILIALGKNNASVKDLAKELKIEASEILEHMLILKSRALIDYEGIVGNTPLYVRK